MWQVNYTRNWLVNNTFLGLSMCFGCLSFQQSVKLEKRCHVARSIRPSKDKDSICWQPSHLSPIKSFLITDISHTIPFLLPLLDKGFLDGLGPKELFSISIKPDCLFYQPVSAVTVIVYNLRLPTSI